MSKMDLIFAWILIAIDVIMLVMCAFNDEVVTRLNFGLWVFIALLAHITNLIFIRKEVR